MRTTPRGELTDSRAPAPRDRGVVVVLALLAVAARLPFRADVLVNWDAVNFALGAGSFDLATHQPHPPGYLGWVALTRAATAITSDPNAAMTLLSAISGAVATALVFLIARRYVSRPAAVVAALLFSTAPLVWYYSVVALSYMTTGAVTLALLLALLVALQRRSGRALVAAGVLLAVVGALRPTDQVMLLPAWLAVAWTFGWHTRIRAALTTGAASLLWVAPLLALSGGLDAFRGQSSAVAELAGGRTWILGGNLAGIGQNLGMVTAGLLLGLFGGLIVLLVARARGIRPYGDLHRDEARLLLAWVTPPLLVYLLVHTGQLGYVILLLPVVYLGVARALPPLVHDLRTSATHWRPTGMVARPRRATAIVATLLLVNAIAFVALPPAGLQVLEMTAAAASRGEETGPPAALDRSRQYDLRANDKHWHALVRFVERFDSDTTAVVTETSSAGSFRHLSYYLPDHNVYGLGWDRTGDLGYLFHARERRTTYAVETLDHAEETMILDPDVDTVVVPDGRLLERLEDSAVADVEHVRIEGGPTVALVRLGEAGGIVVDNPEASSPTSRADGFPDASHRNTADGEEATIRFVPVDVAHEQRPDEPLHGVTLSP